MEKSSPQSRECVTVRGMWTHKLMSFQHTEMERFCRKLLFITSCSGKPRVDQILSTGFLDRACETKDKQTPSSTVAIIQSRLRHCGFKVTSSADLYCGLGISLGFWMAQFAKSLSRQILCRSEFSSGVHNSFPFDINWLMDLLKVNIYWSALL